MKKLFLFALLITTFSCSKQKASLNNPNLVVNPPPLISKHIDFTFTLNSSCEILYDTLYRPLAEKIFFLSAAGNNAFSGSSTNMSGSIGQGYMYYNNLYSDVFGSLSQTGTQNIINFKCTDFSLFALPVNGSYNFSGAGIVNSGTGIFKNASTSSLSPLTITGFANAANNTGQFRIRGVIYY